jgi:DNA-binding GntR family transcriptional regulator
LVEQELGVTLGVSRTPIREALGELAAVGLVTIKPNQGAFVRPFGPVQIREIYHIRWLLESEAARRAAGYVREAELRQVQLETQQHLNLPRSSGWIATALSLDERFHELIARNCGSVRLAEEIGRYRTLIQSIRAAVGNRARAQEVAIVEHLKVIDHLLSHDSASAGRAMAEHIQRGTQAAVDALFSPVDVK